MTVRAAYLCDYVRTPIGRYGGALAHLRTDDLAAAPIRALTHRYPSLDWAALDDVVIGCANQAGEDNRNVARMALLLAGLPESVPGVTVNRLCGSGMEAVAIAANAIASGHADLVIAGGVESMSRAPFVMPKPVDAFSRNVSIYDTTIGWRFVNPQMHAAYGTDSMPETAERLARDMHIARADQDRFAYWSQQKADAAKQNGALAREIIPVSIPNRSGESTCGTDEHPRETSLERLAQLPPITGPGGTVTAGNSSGINDGAAALILAADHAISRHGLTPRARVLGSSVAGVEPRRMGLGPVPATRRLLTRLRLEMTDFDAIELNEAFAAQALACLRQLGLPDHDDRINPLGGAIALGHPLGMSGARIVGAATHHLVDRGCSRALCTMCIGVGQGISIAIERTP